MLEEIIKKIKSLDENSVIKNGCLVALERVEGEYGEEPAVEIGNIFLENKKVRPEYRNIINMVFERPEAKSVIQLANLYTYMKKAEVNNFMEFTQKYCAEAFNGAMNILISNPDAATSLLPIIKNERPNKLVYAERDLTTSRFNDVVQLYKNKKGFQQIVFYLGKLAFKPGASFHFAVDGMKEKNVQDTIDLYQKNKYCNRVASLLCKAVDEGLQNKVCTLLKRTKDDSQNYIYLAMHKMTEEYDKFKLVVRIFDKYKKCDYQGIAKYIDSLTRESFSLNDLKEFLTKRAYRVLSKSRNVIKDMSNIHTNYGSSAVNIKERQVKNACSYSDFDLIKSTEELVKAVHERRDEDDYHKIMKGFYSELNRAIRQSTDFKGKIRNLRQYCNEVQKQMKDNAEELMVMANE